MAGGPPKADIPEGGAARSFLMRLCEDGQQMVNVTKMYKKNVAVMYPDMDAGLQYLDQYASPDIASNTHVTWKTRYLVEKEQMG